MLCTNSIPSRKESPSDTSVATSSVGLIREADSSAKFSRRPSSSRVSSSRLSIRPMATSEKRPRCEVSVIGCDSMSLMMPIPCREPSKRGRSSSNLLRK